MDVDALLKSPVTTKKLARLSPLTDGENGEMSRSNGLNGQGLRSESPPPSSSTLRKPSSTKPSIPAKRKQHPSPPPISSASRSAPLTATHRISHSNPASSDVDPESIRCICSIPTDDGWSIGCDGCTRWLHGVCVGFPKQERLKLPEKWLCWSCDPAEIQRSLSRLGIDKDSLATLETPDLLKLWKERARNIQMNRVRLVPPHDEPRKPRRISTNTASVDDHHGGPQNKRKRLVGASPMTPASSSGHGYFPFNPSFPSFPNTGTPPPNLDDSLDETQDVVLDGEVKERLGRLAKEYAFSAANATGTTTPDWMKGAGEWRGVSAISAPSRKRRKKENPHWEPVVYFGDTLPKKPKVSLQPHPPFPTPTLPVPSLPPLVTPSAAFPPPIPPPPPPLPSPLPTSSSSTINGHHPSSQFEQQQLLPPTYTLHTSHAVPSASYLLPYPSLITSSASYLSDPLNGYAKMGMPKSGVRLVGGRWNVALDPKGVQEGQPSTSNHLNDKDSSSHRKDGGGSSSKAWAKWARNGCRPNAVVRPVVVVHPKKKKSGKGKEKESENDTSGRSRTSSPHPPRPVSGVKEAVFSASPAPPQPSTPPPEASTSTSSPPPTPKVSFALFALRDLKANEEIVLDWEWDDACVVHLLPKIEELRQRKRGSGTQEGEEGEQEEDEEDDEGYDLKHLRLQFAGILRALGDTFTSCACEDHLRTDVEENVGGNAGNVDGPGSRESSSTDVTGTGSRLGRRRRRREECVLRRMREFVEYGHFQEDKGPENDVVAMDLEEGIVDEDIDIDVVGDSPTKDPSSAATGDITMVTPPQPAGTPKVAVDLGPLIGRPRFFRTKEIQKDGRNGFGVGGVEMDEDDGELRVPLGPRMQPPNDHSEDGNPSMAYHYQHSLPYPTLPSFFQPPPTPTTPGLFSPQYGYPFHPYPYGYPPSFWVPPSTETVSPNLSVKRKEPSPSSKSLLWGERPPAGAKSARDAEDSGTDGRHGRQHPQRHQRKRTDQRKVSSAPTDLEQLQVGDAVEEEMPPKMKRRLNLVHGSQSKGTQKALGKQTESRVSTEHREEAGKSPVNRPRSRMSISELTDGGGSRALPVSIMEKGMTEPAPGPIYTTPISPPTTHRPSDLKTPPLMSPILPRHQPTSTPLPIAETADGRMRSSSTASIPQNAAVNSPSPLLSLANLRIVSPAIASTGSSSLYHTPHVPGPSDMEPSRQSRLEEREERSKKAQREAQKALQRHPELRLRNEHPKELENVRARVTTDPLAALAAAAAAARPISPLPARSREPIYEADEREPEARWNTASRSSFFGSSSPGVSPRVDLHSNLSPLVNPRSPLRSSPRELHFTRPSFRPSTSPRTEQRVHVMQDNTFYRSHDDSFTRSNESRISPRVAERISSHEPNSALLGPGGISLLSSPEHAWVPLRRGNVSDGFDEPPPVVSSPRTVAPEQPQHRFDEDLTPASPIVIVNAESLRIKKERMGEEVDRSTSSPIPSDNLAGEEMVVDPTPSHGDSASPPLQSVHQPLSPADSYVAPLSPLRENLSDIPPWPKSPSPWESESTPSKKDIRSPALNAESVEPVEASRATSTSPLVQQDDAGERSTPPSHQHADYNVRMASHPINSASSSPRSSPAPEVYANVVPGQVMMKTPSPLSSPLSSPVDKLISLPPHSVPTENNVEMEPSSDQTPASRPPSPNTLEIPSLEHSRSESMSPQSPGRISPTTPLNDAGMIEEPNPAIDIGTESVEIKSAHPESTSASILASPVISSEDPHGPLNDMSASTLSKSYEMDTTMSDTVSVAPTETPAPPPTKVKLTLKDFAERRRREREEKEKVEREEKERVEEEERAKEASLKDLQDKEGLESALTGAINEDSVDLSLDVKQELVEESGPLSLIDTVPASTFSSSDAVVPAVIAASSSPNPPNVGVSESGTSNDHVQETRTLQEYPQTDNDLILKASATRNKLISSLSSVLGTLQPSYLSQDPPPHSPAPEPRDRSDVIEAGVENPEDGEIQDGEVENETSEDKTTSHNISSPSRALSPPPPVPSTTLPSSLPAKPSPSYNGLPPKTNAMTATSMKASTASGTKSSYSPPPSSRLKFTDTAATNSVPRARTPPKQPRLFDITRRSPSVPSSLHGSPPMRKLSVGPTPAAPSPAAPSSSSASIVSGVSSNPTPAHGSPPTALPAQSAAASSTFNPALGKTPPSGPRALRQLQQQQQQNGGGGHMNRGSGPFHAPRAFPAYSDRYRDRERDRDRDRGRDGYWGSRGIRTRDGNSG